MKKKHCRNTVFMVTRTMQKKFQIKSFFRPKEGVRKSKKSPLKRKFKNKKIYHNKHKL